MRIFPSGCSAAPTATAVCEPLCGSIPIITAISALPSAPATRQTAAGMPYTGPALGVRPSFEPRHGKIRQGRRIDLKPGTRGPAGGSGASPIGPLRTLRQPATPSRTVSIRRLGCAPGADGGPAVGLLRRWRRPAGRPWRLALRRLAPGRVGLARWRRALAAECGRQHRGAPREPRRHGHWPRRPRESGPH